MPPKTAKRPNMAPHYLVKTVLLEVKQADASFAERTFSGYGAVFNNRDEGGDVIMPGAFAGTMDRIRAGKVKLLDGHQSWGGVSAVMGKLTEATEDGTGLWCTFRVSEGMCGDDLLHKIMDGSVDALSIGYECLDFEEIHDEATEECTRYLKELKLWEISVVIWGMNPLALIDPASVKSIDDLFRVLPDLAIAAYGKAGQRNSGADAALIQECIDKLKSLLDDTPAPTEGDGGKSKSAHAPGSEPDGDTDAGEDGEGSDDESDADGTDDSDDAETKARESAEEERVAEVMRQIRLGIIIHGS